MAASLRVHVCRTLELALYSHDITGQLISARPRHGSVFPWSHLQRSRSSCFAYPAAAVLVQRPFETCGDVISPHGTGSVSPQLDGRPAAVAISNIIVRPCGDRLVVVTPMIRDHYPTGAQRAISVCASPSLDVILSRLYRGVGTSDQNPPVSCSKASNASAGGPTTAAETTLIGQAWPRSAC